MQNCHPTEDSVIAEEVDMCETEQDSQCCMYSTEHGAQVKCMYGHKYKLDGLFQSAVTDVRKIKRKLKIYSSSN